MGVTEDLKDREEKGGDSLPHHPFLQGSSGAISGILYLRLQFLAGCPSPGSRAATVSVTAPCPAPSGPEVEGLPAFAISWVPHILLVLRSLFTPVQSLFLFL